MWSSKLDEIEEDSPLQCSYIPGGGGRGGGSDCCWSVCCACTSGRVIAGSDGCPASVLGTVSTEGGGGRVVAAAVAACLEDTSLGAASWSWSL